MIRTRCLLCGAELAVEEAESLAMHKKNMHSHWQHYGCMWPLQESFHARYVVDVPMIESPIIARELGVDGVYIRWEGIHPSGSMKDYLARFAVQQAVEAGFRYVSVVSSGNHAVALAQYAHQFGLTAIVFVPATTSKLPLLQTLPGSIIIAVSDAIFEEVFVIGNIVNDMPEIANVNVGNESLFLAYAGIASEIAKLERIPTHIMAGVGNGTYLASIAWGLQHQELPTKVVPVGMVGAFPLEIALQKPRYAIVEFDEFQAPEESIDAAEGSIAVASYSLPQLVHGVRVTNGYCLGGLTNHDLAMAYRVLEKDVDLLHGGMVPEPTGIMGLAAALKYKDAFQPDSCILFSFTGSGIKDVAGVRRLWQSADSNGWTVSQVSNHVDHCHDDDEVNEEGIYYVDKKIETGDLRNRLETVLSGGVLCDRLR